MKKKTWFRIVAIISGIVGVAIITSVIYSLADYANTSKQKFPSLLSPVVAEKDAQTYDYTKASNWFAGTDKSQFTEDSKITFYNISIPRLKIDNAVVAIGGEDLAKHLIQYPGTALPGKRGNAVIFGHSTLPSFFNPKSYISIFSTLPTLEKGDQIIVNYDSIEYSYKVESMVEVLPTDIEMFDQNISDSFLTLVTCTPPGDPRKPRRLLVRARLAPIGEVNYATRG